MQSVKWAKGNGGVWIGHQAHITTRNGCMNPWHAWLDEVYHYGRKTGWRIEISNGRQLLDSTERRTLAEAKLAAREMLDALYVTAREKLDAEQAAEKAARQHAAATA